MEPLGSWELPFALDEIQSFEAGVSENTLGRIN